MEDTLEEDSGPYSVEAFRKAVEGYFSKTDQFGRIVTGTIEKRIVDGKEVVREVVGHIYYPGNNCCR